MKRVLLIAVVAAMSLPAGSQAGTLTFVLAGQSNMAGFGPLPVSFESNPNVVAFNTATGWLPAVEPLQDGGGSGPAISFGDTVVARTHATVRLIPCASNGSTLSRWMLDGDLYKLCLSRLLAAGSPHIDGILFFQGEGDTQKFPLAATWAERFTEFVDQAAQDLGNSPLVYAQIGRTVNPLQPAWDVVKAQQAGFAHPRVEMIQTDDLEQLPPQFGVHFTLGSYRTIGERFAEAWLAMHAYNGQGRRLEFP